MTGYRPMKAVLGGERECHGPGWVFERKLDGVRCGVLREGGEVRLLSRTGERLDDTYPELVQALRADGPNIVADGEVVAFAGPRTSFERLQRRMQIRDPERARRSGVAVYCYLFDLLELVGTGFDEAALERLGDELEHREQPSPPFAAGQPPRSARWARPELVAQIAFTEWTRDGRLRHPRYQGLRSDKPAREVVREERG